MVLPFPTLRQPQNGYRYGLDSFLLVRFAEFHRGDLVCDLGAGVGIIGLLALQRKPVKKVTAVEIQQELATLAEENAKSMGFEKRLEVRHTDWRHFGNTTRTKFHVVISNPPYRAKKSGRLPPQASRAIAKHEVNGTMGDLIQCAQKILKPSGRFYLIYPPLRLEELLTELSRMGFKARRIAFIHPYLDRPAGHVMVEAVRSQSRELKIEPPVIVYRDPDHYQPEIEKWVGKKRQV